MPKGYSKTVSDEPARRACRVDYLNKDMVSRMEDVVDCDGKCDDGFSEEQMEALDTDKEYEECVDDCHKMIKEYSRGSIIYKESGEVIDANIPLTLEAFWEEDKWGDQMLPENWEKKVLEKFDALGCEPDPDIGFRHPHEFAKPTAGSEPEEDPEAFALHVRGGGAGRCMMDDVAELLNSL